MRITLHSVRTNQWSESIYKSLDLWTINHGVILKLIQADKPILHDYIEAKFRDECLNEHRFWTLSHARKLISDWQIDYNENRPPPSKGYLTPSEYAAVTRTGLINDNVPTLLKSIGLVIGIMAIVEQNVSTKTANTLKR